MADVRRLSLCILLVVSGGSCEHSRRAGPDPGEVDGGGQPTDMAAMSLGGPCDAAHPCPSGERCLEMVCIPDNGLCHSDDECQNDSWCRCAAADPGDGGTCDGVCVPRGRPDDPGVDRTCRGPAAPLPFTPPALKCKWIDNKTGVGVTPVVADLDGDHLPEIVSSTFEGTIIAIRGSDCGVMFERSDHFFGHSGLAVGDLDGDGVPEIVATSWSEYIILVLDNHGAILAKSPLQAHGVIPGSVPSIADLDNQAPPEIISRGQVLRYQRGNPTLTVVWDKPPPADSFEAVFPIVADVDGDHKPDVVLGRQIRDALTGADKTPPGLVALPAGGGIAAFADFNGDQRPEMVLSLSSAYPAPKNPVASIYIHDMKNDKVLLGPYSYPYKVDSARMGPPLIDDLDGDGVPEAVTTTSDGLRAFSLRCLGKPLPMGCASEGILWTKTIQDKSSGFTSVTSFDFNGDGVVEIVHRDECWLRILDGRNGKTLWATSSNSATGAENPVVADVDADNHADIVVVADTYIKNQCDGSPEPDTGAPFTGYQAGIFVYHDPLKRYMPTRRIWNQHSYHVTNVNDDGRIPVVEKDSWTVENNYRRNHQGVDPRSPVDLPDATAAADPAAAAQVADCMVSWTLRARLCNRGGGDLEAGTPATFYAADPRSAQPAPPALCTARSTGPTAAGACTNLECEWKSPTPGPVDLWLRVNDDGAGHQPVRECRTGNNLLLQRKALCRKIG